MYWETQEKMGQKSQDSYLGKPEEIGNSKHERSGEVGILVYSQMTCLMTTASYQDQMLELI